MCCGDCLGRVIGRVWFGTQGPIVHAVTTTEFAVWVALLMDEWIPPQRPLLKERGRVAPGEWLQQEVDK